MLFDEGDDKMVKTEAFPTIRMKIDRLLKITNEYQFNDLVKAVYCINLCINNRSVLESCLALNACLIEYEEKGSKRIGTYDEFKGFFGKIYDVMKPGIADDYTVEDFGEVQLRYNDKFYRVIIGTGHNNVYACLNFLPTLARNISREEELCLALEYVSGTIDYFIEENKNDGVVEKRFVLPTEILFYKVQKFFKEEVKKYDILELDSLMMSEGTTIEKSHFVCREDNIYPLYNVSLLIDLYDIWENKIDFKEQISVANEGIIDRIYSLFEMDRSRSCSIFAPAMIFPEQKYDSSQRTYTFIAKASRGVVVALNADEYEEGQLEKEIANIEKYHKSGTLHIAETFNRFDKSGLRGIHIPADMPIEYLIYDSFMNPNQMHMSLGEEGKKRKTCTALDVIYYLNFMDDIDELFEYLSYSNEKDYESSFGFGSDAALYFTWKNQDRYIAKGAIIFNMVDVGYDTENEAVVDYFLYEDRIYVYSDAQYYSHKWIIRYRRLTRYEGEHPENFRSRIAMYEEICKLGGTNEGVLLAVRTLGYTSPVLVRANDLTGFSHFTLDGSWLLDGSRTLESDTIENRWAEFYIVIVMDADEEHPISFDIMRKTVRKWKEVGAKDNYFFKYNLSIRQPHTGNFLEVLYKKHLFYYDYRKLDGMWKLDGSYMLDAEMTPVGTRIGYRYESLYELHEAGLAVMAYNYACRMVESAILKAAYSFRMYYFEYLKTDGSWTTDGSYVVDAQMSPREMRWSTTFRHQHEEKLLMKQRYRMQPCEEAYSIRKTLEQYRMVIDYFDYLKLNGLWKLTGSRLMDAQRTEYTTKQAYSFGVEHTREFRVIWHEEHNLIFLDGTWSLDGSKIIDAWQKTEVL